MGRIKTKNIKRTTQTLIEKHSQLFSSDFEKNKKVVDALVDTNKYKKMRNTIAGYATRMKRKGR